jgi:putative FmdB family regulatory protein
MPNYHYVCNNNECAHVLEQQRSVDDRRAHTLCPSCLEGLMELQPAAPGFSLSGRGWTGKSGKGRVK